MLSDDSMAYLVIPQLLGYFLNWALLGVLSVQAYLYYVHFPHDGLVYQCLVYCILAIEWVQTALMTSDAFQKYAYHYGDIKALTTIYNAWFSVSIMCVMVSTVVQGFFAWRIYLLARSRVLIAVIAVLTLAQSGAGIASGVQSRDPESTAELASSDSRVIASFIWLIGSVVVDTIITITMIVLLLRMKTGFRQTDTAINKIVRLVVETGMLTATCAILTVALCLGFPGKLYYESVALILAKIYANTFLTNLLNRAFLRSGADDDCERDQDRERPTSVVVLDTLPELHDSAFVGMAPDATLTTCASEKSRIDLSSRSDLALA